MAQWVRFAIGFFGIALAGATFLALPSGWGWLVALAIFGARGIAAERAFRWLASPEEVRQDLEERVRNPPD